jgi:hypothetical protein
MGGKAGKAINGYTVMGKLGQGTYAKVYKA